MIKKATPQSKPAGAIPHMPAVAEFERLSGKASDLRRKEKQLQSDYNIARDEQSAGKLPSKVQAAAHRLLDEGGTSTATLEAPPDLTAMKDDLAAAGQALRMCEAKLAQSKIAASYEYCNSLATEHDAAVLKSLQGLVLLRDGLAEHQRLFDLVHKNSLTPSGPVRAGEGFYCRRAGELMLTKATPRCVDAMLDRLSRAFPQLVADLKGV